MRELTASKDSLVVRTDFSDDAAWARICKEIEAPVGEFRAYVSFVSDPGFAGLTTDELTALAPHGPYRSFLFVVDRESLRNPEHPILVLDQLEQPGRTFRVVPSQMLSVENNLSLGNMDISEREQPRQHRAWLPSAEIGVGQGLRHRRIAGPDPQGLH